MTSRRALPNLSPFLDARSYFDSGRESLRRKHRRLLSSLLVLMVLTTTASGAQNLIPSKCYKTLFRHLPWVTSGVEVSDGSGFWVAEAARGEILKIDTSGTVSSPGWTPEHLEKARQIRRARNGYAVLRLVGERVQEVYFLDSEFAVLYQLKLERADANFDVDAIYDFVPLGEGILAFGDLESRSNRGTYTTGFFYVDRDGSIKVLQKVETQADVVFNYATDNSLRFLANLNGVGYILFLEERPYIGRVDLENGSIDELPSFPEEYRFFPRVAQYPAWLQAPNGVSKTKAFLETIESSKTTLGLFAGPGDSLFLLAKTAMDSEKGTSWLLIRVDPTTGAEQARFPLPVSTSAAHLVLVPGDDFFAAIEKGRVIGIKGAGLYPAPYLSTKSMTLIPKEWFVQGDRWASEKAVHCFPVP